MANPKDTGVPENPAPEGAEAGPEEVSFDELANQLEAELKKVPPQKLAEAQKQVADFLGGDLKWADLADWTPEKLHETAKEGYAQYEAAQYDQAEIIFKGLTVLDPDNFYYHQMLGACFQQQKKFAESIVEYSIAVDLKPDDITSFTNRGEVYYELKLWDLAERDFNEAIRLDTTGGDRWANRSRLLLKKLAGLRSTQPVGASEPKIEAGDK